MPKVLVIHAGDQVEALFTKIETLNSKNGPFEVIITGDLLLNEESAAKLIDGSIQITASCYFVLGSKALPKNAIDKIVVNNGELCPNLVFLGKQATYTLSSGLRIAVFGGKFDLDQFTNAEMDNATKPLESPYFTASSVASFKEALNPVKANPDTLKAASEKAPTPVDILITQEWPTQITNLSSKLPKDQSLTTSGVPAIQEILIAAKPRYHFSSASEFWERETFRWPTSSKFTRFISVAPLNNAAKERAFYAFNLAPGDEQNAPNNSTSCPLDGAMGANRGTKRPLTETDESPQNYIFGGAGHDRKSGKRGQPVEGYVCRLCNQPGHFIQDCPMAGEKPQKKQRKELSPAECWFCLSNPKVSKHLIASIGNETYLTLPKGQLPSVPEGTPVPGGGHCLIIPIGHFPTLRMLPDEQRPAVTAEVEKYKAALRKCYQSYGCSFVAFEVGRVSGKGSHAHIQIVPIPQNSAGRVESTFKEHGAKEGYTFLDDADQVLQESSTTENYFLLDLPDGRKLVHLIKAGKPFNLQFGRTALAAALGAPDRADWKVCARSDPEEKVECQAFKKAFAPFDPANQ